MLILHVSPKDMGEYTISAENGLGRAECSTTLSVSGERDTLFQRIDELKNILNDAKLFISFLQSEDTKGPTI